MTSGVEYFEAALEQPFAGEPDELETHARALGRAGPARDADERLLRGPLGWSLLRRRLLPRRRRLLPWRRLRARRRRLAPLIAAGRAPPVARPSVHETTEGRSRGLQSFEIGRASCRGRV